MTPKVLFYDPTGAASAAKWVLARARIRICPVTAAQAGLTVGALADGQTAPADAVSPAALPQDPVLIFCGLTEAQLDAALAGLRRAGLPRSVYKAVLTAHNASWTFADLCAELARERAAYAAQKPQG